MLIDFRQGKLPELLSDQYVEPVLLAHLHMARCNNKKIVNQKNLKLEILFQCKQYYQVSRYYYYSFIFC